MAPLRWLVRSMCQRNTFAVGTTFVPRRSLTCGLRFGNSVFWSWRKLNGQARSPNLTRLSYPTQSQGWPTKLTQADKARQFGSCIPWACCLNLLSPYCMTVLQCARSPTWHSPGPAGIVSARAGLIDADMPPCRCWIFFELLPLSAIISSRPLAGGALYYEWWCSRRYDSSCGCSGSPRRLNSPFATRLISSLRRVVSRLMVAFLGPPASGNDAIQARAAVQREANAIENVIALLVQPAGCLAARKCIARFLQNARRYY